MAKPKKRSIPDTSSTNAFLEALRFLSLILLDKGSPVDTHCFLNNGYATAFNGIVAAGVKITEQIYAAPNNAVLVEALSKCGQNISITQLDNFRLSIKSDKFKAVVPCLDPSQFQLAQPDPPIAVIDDRLKVAMNAVEVLANVDAEEVIQASILLHNGSAFATNRSVIFEYFHDIDLPPNLAIPKSFVKALIKTPKRLVSFGYSDSSITFYFDDESFLRTQLYAQAWPNVVSILNNKCNPWAVPADFFKGLASIAPFSPDGLCYFGKELIQSHSEPNAGATYEVPGLPFGPIFNIKQLLLLKDHAETIDFMAKGQNGTYLAFFGKNIRGAIAGREPRREYVAKKDDYKPNTNPHDDDNISF